MKRMAFVSALLGAAIFAFAGTGVAAAGSAPTVCPNAAQGSTSIAGTVIPGNLTVPAGVDCRLGWNVEVKGNAQVSGNLYTFGPVHFDNQVIVNPGGSFAASNYGVTIDGNLQITDPAANSGNGFWGDQPLYYGGPNTFSTVKGNLIYTITPAAAAAYPQYQWPYLYGHATTVEKNVTYSVGALSSVRPWSNVLNSGLTVEGSTTLS